MWCLTLGRFAPTCHQTMAKGRTITSASSVRDVSRSVSIEIEILVTATRQICPSRFYFQPLKINPTFYSMSEHTIAELTLAMSPAPGKNTTEQPSKGVEGNPDLFIALEIDLAAECDQLDKLVPAFHLPRLCGSDVAFHEGRPNVGAANSHGFTLVSVILIRCLSWVYSKLFIAGRRVWSAQSYHQSKAFKKCRAFRYHLQQ